MLSSVISLINQNFLLIAGGLGLLALVAFLFEHKTIGAVFGTFAALFVFFNLYSDISANQKTQAAEFQESKAQFNMEWAKATDGDKKTVSELTQRYEAARAAAEQAASDQKIVESKNEMTRKPVEDAVNKEMTDAANKILGNSNEKDVWVPPSKK